MSIIKTSVFRYWRSVCLYMYMMGAGRNCWGFILFKHINPNTIESSRVHVLLMQEGCKCTKAARPECLV